MPEKPKIRVAVVSIPIVQHEVYHLGRAYVSRYEYFSRGLLDNIRKEVINHIKNNSHRFNCQVEVTDAKDIFHEDHTSPKIYAAGKKGDYIDADVVKQLGEKIKQLKDTHDLVVVIGTKHTGAAFLYTVDGNVARFDAHTDRAEYGSPGEFNYANYVDRIIKEGIKEEQDIKDYGVRGKKIPKRKVDAEIFDIDMDVFSGKYEMQDMYDVGKARIPDIGRHIENSKRIHTIGFFEYWPEMDEHHTGLRTIKALTLAAMRAIERRKLNPNSPK
ncbi:MAG: hypothetical protein J7K68_01270 [Candidatus Diapherotrites archaeon]|nr:hypothetical protein [Candidatus Diapherotrites archaeon]